MSFFLKIAACANLMLWALLCGLVWGAEEDLAWSTFLGGVDVDYGYDLVLDKSGRVWVTGVTNSADFPTTAGAFDTTIDGRDLYVAGLSNAGNTLLRATFLGGTGADEGLSLALDPAGNIYVTGWTQSADFPTTPGAYDVSLGGVADAFVIKLAADTGDLDYATLLGGNDYEVGYRLAVDGSGRAYVVGTTSSMDFATTPGSYDTSYNGDVDTFVARLNSAGSAADYATFLGGHLADYGLGIALSGSGSAYVAGYTYSPDFPTTAGSFQTVHRGLTDVFVVRLSPLGSDLMYSTLLGGTFRDAARSVVVDEDGSAYVTGYTHSPDYPTTAAALDTTLIHSDVDAFVSKISSTGHFLALSTFLGGEAEDSGYGIILDNRGSICVIGFTASVNFPTTLGAFDRSYNGQRDVFVSLINSLGSAIDYSTFLGGGGEDYGWDIAMEAPAAVFSHSVFMTGDTQSEDFPTTEGAFAVAHSGSKDAFVLKLVLDDLVPVEPMRSSARVPCNFLLKQNYPNPFNASTGIRYQIPSTGHVSLKVFNPLGQEVRTLVDEIQGADWHAALWDGRDDLGHQVASGAYFCRLRAGDFHDTVKMLLVR